MNAFRSVTGFGRCLGSAGKLGRVLADGRQCRHAMPLAVPCLGGQGCVRFTHSTREENISITWVLKDGAELVKPAAVGDTFLQAAHRHEIPMEGACEGVCACSTCHCIFERSVYDDLPEPSEAEDDMLDQAFGQTPTSRLGCQVTLTEDMNGIRVQLPKATRNFYVDGHVPKPH